MGEEKGREGKGTLLRVTKCVVDDLDDDYHDDGVRGEGA